MPWDFSKIPVFAPAGKNLAQARSSPNALGRPGFMRPKLTVGRGDDPLEHEADRIADHVMRMAGPRPSVTAAPAMLNRKCAACDEEEQRLQAKAGGSPQAATGEAPGVVHEVLRSPGQPLDSVTRSYMENQFGRDFRHVRVHADAKAAESATAVNALAYTVGSNVVFGAGQYAPHRARGQHLLAHELTHVVQQESGDEHLRLQRFVASETPKISPTFQDMLTQVKQLIAAASTNGQLNWDFLVEIAGGTSAGRQMDKALGSKDPTIKSRLLVRYLFTCRCGFIDMRHFLQLLYISNFSTGISQSEARGNRAATRKGREHELTSESESRFGAEDTPSNALGAATNLFLPGLPGSDAVFAAIKDTLTRCDPVDWSKLSSPSKDQIVHFYGDQVPDATKPGANMPKNQNQTAVPDIVPVAECGARERSFPFSLDSADSDRKTVGGKNFLGGSRSLTSASDIREFVDTQRPEIIRLLPLPEKIRFINILLEWPIREADKEAIVKIYKNSTLDELRAEP